MCSMQLLLQHQAHPVTWNSIRMVTRLAVPTPERICLLVKVPTCASLNTVFLGAASDCTMNESDTVSMRAANGCAMNRNDNYCSFSGFKIN